MSKPPTESQHAICIETLFELPSLRRSAPRDNWVVKVKGNILEFVYIAFSQLCPLVSRQTQLSEVYVCNRLEMRHSCGNLSGSF